MKTPVRIILVLTATMTLLACEGTIESDHDDHDRDTDVQREHDPDAGVEHEPDGDADAGVEPEPRTCRDGELGAGALLGVEAMPDRQLDLNTQSRRPRIRDVEWRQFEEPVKILLSKKRYFWEDCHLDAVVWISSPDAAAGEPPSGYLDVRLEGDAGEVVAEHRIDDIAPAGLFFSVGLPETLSGTSGMLTVTWRDGDEVLGESSAPFDVASPSDVPLSGRIPIEVLNEPGATVDNAPMTVGVPFPRGALFDPNNVRLVDESGREIPLQTRISARWSRFGSVKWLLCDFTADLAGSARELFLEYGPSVSREQIEPMNVTTSASEFPDIDAGRLRVSSDGIGFDVSGDGTYQSVLDSAALYGAFVHHEEGAVYVVPRDVAHTIEEQGSEKVVVHRTGWYVDESSGDEFCKFVTRFVFHRDSPVVRIFHTWIFTGDGNQDRIRDMGWRFVSADSMVPEGFLSSFQDGQWLSDSSLVQFDYQNYLLSAAGTEHEGRATGVMSASVGNARVSFGAKDFWQNFPSELELTDTGFTFYNWPNRNPPARFERPVPHSKAILHRFAHEGELLDFRLPQEYTEGSIWRDATNSGRELHWAEGRPESANAQGIARTEEMFLYLTDSSRPLSESAAVLQGLNDESLRAVADTAWVASSEVFGKIHHKDTAKYAEDEYTFEQIVHAPARWMERLGFYGMWLHGDVPAWGINLHNRSVSLYRAIRKNHHGWPVGWVPYARSGDPRLLKYAEAATRQMTDANFSHYFSEDVEESVGPDHYRALGWWDRSMLPWASRNGPRVRGYTVDSNYIWHAYYLTGYTRARDVALLFAELTKEDDTEQRGPRSTNSTMTSYLDIYEATFDPWFLVAAHVIADGHLHLLGSVDPDDPSEGLRDRLTAYTSGHFWRPADLRIHDFTGDPKYYRMAYNHAVSWSSPRAYAFGGLWPRLALPAIPQAAYAHQLNGDSFHLARAAAYLDWANMGIYDGDLEYGRGTITQGGTARGLFTGYYIRQFPLALGAFERAGQRPAPIPTPFYVDGADVPGDDSAFEFRHPEVIFRKSGSDPVSLFLASHDDVQNQEYAYTVLSYDDEMILTGNWPSAENRARTYIHTLELPGDVPDGLYRLHVTGRVPYVDDTPEGRSRVRRRHGRILTPSAAPDVPEVMVFESDESGTSVASGGPEEQYWFKVPAGVSEFWIDFPSQGGDFSRQSVWNPAGERAWDRSFSNGDGRTGRVTISVEAEHADKIWRATGGQFTIDPQIPPYFSISGEKWFNPAE